MELNLGPARLVKVQPKLMDFRSENYEFNGKGDVAGWDELRTWELETTNTRTLPVDVEITRGLGTTYWKLAVAESTDGVAYDKHDAASARFTLRLGRRGKKSFGYTVTTYHGTRRQSRAAEMR